MKKNTFFKTLLVAAGLLGGSSAWADPTTVYSKTITDWSSDDLTAWSTTSTSGFSSDATSGTGFAITVKASNDADDAGKVCSYSKTVSPSSTTLLTFQAVWNPGNATGGANAYLSFGDVTFKLTGQAGKAEVIIGSTSTTLATSTGLRSKDWTINVTINQTTNKVSGTASINGTSYDIDGTTANAGSFTSLTFGLGGSVPKWANTTTLKSVSITEEAAAATADVTFKYEDTDGNDLSSLRADVVESNDVDASIEDIITSSLKSSFYNGDESVRYDYSTFACSDETVQAGGSTVTLKFAAKAKYTYNVYAVDGSDNQLSATPIATATAYTGDESKLAWSKYLNVDGQWYVTNTPYGTTVSATGTTNVTYTTADIYNFIECENTSYTSAGDVTGNASYSGGVGVLLSSNYAMATKAKIEAGVYDISVCANVRRANEDGLKLQYSTDNSNWTDVTTLIFASSVASTQTAEKVVLAEDSYIRFVDTKGQNSCHYYDYILLVESSVSTPIPPAGYATYCSPYALDFSGVDGLTAYIITGYESSPKLALVQVNDVPANTGVLLQGAEGTYSIPVVASSSTDVDANKLEGVTEETADVAAGIYVLLNGDNGVGFYQTQNAFTVGANTAYLPAGFTSNAKVRFFGFADDASGIKTMAVEAADNAAIYNLSGQRVNAAYKGIVIKNGKKYLNK